MVVQHWNSSAGMPALAFFPGRHKNHVSPITFRPMRLDDIPFGMSLSAAEGWNQTHADWHMLLEHTSGGCFVAAYNNLAVGTITTLTYTGNIHWIGMVLVAEQYRRKGIGRALVEASLNWAAGKGTAYLDATPQGQPLYEALGFQPLYPIKRYLRSPNTKKTSHVRDILPVTAELFPRVVSFDTSVFGTNRSKILRNLFLRAPELALATMDKGGLTGSCLGRYGRKYAQVGPLNCEKIDIATDLLSTTINTHSDQNLIIDTPIHSAGWIELLSTLGFSETRSFLRMCLGKNLLPGPHPRCFAIAGPEIG